MVFNCSVPGCRNKGRGTKYFRVPFTNKQRLEAWQGTCLYLKRYAYKQLESVRICILHFDPKFINDKCRLHLDAIPTLNLPTSSGFSNTTRIESQTNKELFLSLDPWQPGQEVKINVTHSPSKTHCDHSYGIDILPGEITDVNDKSNKTAIKLNLINNSNAGIDADGWGDDAFDNKIKKQPAPALLADITDEVEDDSEALFSWQKRIDLVPTDDKDVLIGPLVEPDVELEQTPMDVSFYCDDDPKDSKRDLDLKHDEYQCNECRQEIMGFRYTCIQCADWDLCGSCEARRAHAEHYVLRVPSPRPYNEIQAVLAAVRQQLLTENFFLHQEITDGSVKSEEEEESEMVRVQESEVVEEPDPLYGSSSHSEESIHTNTSSEESGVCASPRLGPATTDENSLTRARTEPTALLENLAIDHGNLSTTPAPGNPTRTPSADCPSRLASLQNSRGILEHGPAAPHWTVHSPFITLDALPLHATQGKRRLESDLHPNRSTVKLDRVERAVEGSSTRLSNDPGAVVLQIPAGTRVIDLEHVIQRVRAVAATSDGSKRLDTSHEKTEINLS